MLDTVVKLPPQRTGPHNGTPRMGFTSGGPGVGRKGCCAVGINLNIDNGTAHGEVENWSLGAKGRDDQLCDSGGGHSTPGAECVARLGPLWGKQVAISWSVQHRGRDVVYEGYASVNGGPRQLIARLARFLEMLREGEDKTLGEVDKFIEKDKNVGIA